MIHKLINHWNERPSAFLQNPCAFDLTLNKGAMIAILVSFRTQTSLSYNSSSLMAHRLRKLCLRGRWWSWKGIPGEYGLFIDFLLICPVKSSPVSSYAKVSSVSPPLNSPLLPFRGEGLCRFIGGRSPPEVFETFLTSKDRKIKANGGWLKIYDFKKTFALAHSMPSSVTFIVTELSEQGIERVGISGSGIWTKYSAIFRRRQNFLTR